MCRLLKFDLKQQTMWMFYAFNNTFTVKRKEKKKSIKDESIVIKRKNKFRHFELSASACHDKCIKVQTLNFVFKDRKKILL